MTRATAFLLMLCSSLAACRPERAPATQADRVQAPAPFRFDAVEREIGKRTDAQVQEEAKPFENPALQRYCDGVLGRVTAAADASGEHWTLRILDSAYVSVRSAPGGYVFVTRGLLAFLGSEADLAAAFAHEVAHVTLRHWKTEMSFLEDRGIDDGDLSRLSADDKKKLYARLRDDELAADADAVKILQRAGYAPTGLVHVLGVFAAFEREAGGNRMPDVLRTHPATDERIAALRGVSTQGKLGTDEYLSRIDGLPFGTDPRRGFLYGDRYVNPVADLELAFATPWRARLVAGDLIAAIPGRGIVAVLSRSANPGLEATRDAVAHGASFSAATLGGHRALVGNVPQQEGLTARTAVLETPDGSYVLAVIAPNEYTHDASVESVFASVAGVTEPALKGVRALRVRITRLARAMTLRQLDSEQPSKTSLRTLALLNGVDAGTELAAGTAVKRIDE